MLRGRRAETDSQLDIPHPALHLRFPPINHISRLLLSLLCTQRQENAAVILKLAASFFFFLLLCFPLLLHAYPSEELKHLFHLLPECFAFLPLCSSLLVIYNVGDSWSYYSISWLYTNYILDKCVSRSCTHACIHTYIEVLLFAGCRKTMSCKFKVNSHDITSKTEQE